jgi:polysaccharide transporter, PST family
MPESFYYRQNTSMEKPGMENLGPVANRPDAQFDPSHTDVKSHAASGFVFSGLAQATQFLTQFVSVIVMARLLDPSDFGLVAMVTPVYSFAVMTHDLGLTQATIQRPQLTSAQINSSFWVNAGISAVVCLSLIALSPAIGWFYHDPRTVPLAAAMALVVFFGSFGDQHGAIMVRRMQFRAQAIINVTSALSALAGTIAWGYLFGGYWSLYAGMMLTTIVPMIGVWLCVNWRPGLPALVAETREILRFGLGITTASFSHFVVQNTTSIAVGRVLGDRPLGLYDRAGRLTWSPLQRLTFSISGVIVPILYRLHDDGDRYRCTFLRAVGSISLMVSPGVIWAIVFAHRLVPVLLGGKWTEATPLFAALSFAALPQLINGSANWLFVTQGRSGQLARWSLWSGGMSLASMAAGLPYGIVGVAVASVIVTLVGTPIIWIYACRSGPVKVKHVAHTLAPQATGCLAAALVLLILDRSGIFSLWILLIVGAALSYVTAIAIVAAFPTGRDAIKRDLDFAKYLVKHYC